MRNPRLMLLFGATAPRVHRRPQRADLPICSNQSQPHAALRIAERTVVTGITAPLTPLVGAVRNSSRKYKRSTRKRQHNQGAKLRTARDHKRLRNGLDGGGHRDISVYIGVRIAVKNSLMSPSGGPARRFMLGRPLSLCAACPAAETSEGGRCPGHDQRGTVEHVGRPLGAPTGCPIEAAVTVEPVQNVNALLKRSPAPARTRS
jgi:hypothetical protein